MVARAKTVEIAPDSETARLIDEAGDAELVLVKGGERFRVVREERSPNDADDIWANYDPEKVRASVEANSGIITPEEAERWKQEIYRRREEGSRHFDDRR